jgi:hypothetical protein
VPLGDPAEKELPMGLGLSLFLLGFGAILAFAVTATVSGVDLQSVGWILMAAGALGCLASYLFWNAWGEHNRAARRTTMIERTHQHV